MKIGLEIKINVTKIEKMRLFKGDHGTFLTMTAFVDTDNPDNYGNNGMVTHKAEKGEERTPILGNTKVFWKDEATPAPKPVNNPLTQEELDALNDDVPF